MKSEARKRIAGNINISPRGCWIWNGKARENGYCRTTFKRANWYIHRLSYYAFVSDIPEGMDVCHKCDVRPCCNPNHLFAGTRKDNMQDAVMKGRQAKGFGLPQTKLSKEDHHKIMAMVGNGLLYRDIAVKFNVTRPRIGQIAIENGVRRNGRKRK